MSNQSVCLCPWQVRLVVVSVRQRYGKLCSKHQTSLTKTNFTLQHRNTSFKLDRNSPFNLYVGVFGNSLNESFKIKLCRSEQCLAQQRAVIVEPLLDWAGMMRLSRFSASCFLENISQTNFGLSEDLTITRWQSCRNSTRPKKTLNIPDPLPLACLLPTNRTKQTHNVKKRRNYMCVYRHRTEKHGEAKGQGSRWRSGRSVWSLPSTLLRDREDELLISLCLRKKKKVQTPERVRVGSTLP